MKVQKIVLTNVMRHLQTTLSLPDTGVVVVTGPNGAGKSTFLDAVAFSHWGKTLRGTPPWRRAVAGMMEVVSDLATVTRRVTARGTKKLSWHTPLESEARKYDTPTKAEQELLNTVGSQDVWRRTHVFSAADAANFSTATDGQRKVLVEKILGTDRFDTGLHDCRADLRVAEGEFIAAERKCSLLIMAVSALKEQLAQLVEPNLDIPEAPEALALADGVDPCPKLLAARVVEIDEGITEIQQAPPVVVESSFIEAVAVARAASVDAANVHKLAVAGECGACKQPYDAVDPAAAEQASAEAVVAWKTAQGDLNLEQVRCDQAMADRRLAIMQLQQDRRGAGTEHQALVDANAAVATRQAEIDRHNEHWASFRRGYEEMLEKHKTQVEELNAKIFDGEDDLDVLQSEQAKAEHEVAELKVCEQVLGLKGVRVPVLGKALGAAEAFANAWLQPLSANIRVRIRPYTVLKDGTTTNSNISLEVEGVGEGYGYAATSGGERRRLDAAILLAFAEVHAASSGRPGGTLWVDEVFDALDEDGCAAAAEMLADIGSRRCVVVITHREDLAQLIRAKARYRVNDGVLTQEL